MDSMAFARILFFSLIATFAAQVARAEPCPVFEKTMSEIEATLDAVDASKQP